MRPDGLSSAAASPAIAPELPGHWSQWTRGWSREARDTLFLLAVLAWTLVPQVPHVPVWACAFAGTALAWRAALAAGQRPLPPRTVTLAILLLACGLTWWTHRSWITREAGLTLLVVLTTLKTLELRARRDATVVFFLGFFLVLTGFLHSQSLVTAMMMGLSVWGLIAALMLSHLPKGRPPLRWVLGQSARLLLIGLPLVVVLFVAFPRVGPLWGQPGDVGGRTGLSEQLKLGDVSELAQSDALALRLKLDGPMMAPAQRYFRGPVLSDLLPNGQWVARPARTQWHMGAGGRAPDTPSVPAQGLDTGTPFEMIVEPSRLPTLALPDLTIGLPQVSGAEVNLSPAPDGVWAASQALSDRLRVKGVLHLQWHLPSPTAVPQARHALTADRELPDGLHPRTRAWAREWMATLPRRDSMSVLHALMAHIHSQPYRYTMAPGAVPSGADPLDHFWLDHRAGFCEHYAASTVVILRSLGIPARLVTGYLGGQVNPFDGVLEVRQSDAHAWIEYWHHGVGWVRADPTAAVAPERVDRSQRPRPPPNALQDLLGEDAAPAWAQHLRGWWGAADHRWNEWVLGYTAQKQRDGFRRWGWDQVDATGLLRLLGGLAAATALLSLGPGLWWWRRGQRRRPADPWLRTWLAVRHALEARGWTLPPEASPRTVAQMLGTRCAPGAALENLTGELASFEDRRYAAPASLPSVPPLSRQRRVLLQAIRRLGSPAAQARA